MNTSVYFFLFLFLFASCKVRKQTAVHRQETTQTECVSLDSLSGRLFSQMSAKREIQTRLFTFTPPDSLGRQAICAVLEMTVEEEGNRKDSVCMESVTFFEENVNSKAVIMQKTGKYISWFSVQRIVWILIFTAVTFALFRYFRPRDR